MHIHNNHMIKKYMLCGLTGWCMEVFWTGMGSALKKDKKLTSNTSIWMFPIYATAVIIEPICNKMCSHHRNAFCRGLVYALCIFATEFISGSLLKKRDCCPWDYSDAKLNINGIIRLDYLPVWFTVGLIYEKILCADAAK